MNEDKTQERTQYPISLVGLLHLTVEKKGSDLHLVAGSPPIIRIYGELVSQDFPVLRPKDMEELLFSILLPLQIRTLEQEWELDCSYSVEGLSRFRGNIMKQRGSYAAVYRAVPYNIKELDTLGLPEEIKKFCNANKGLVLVTGPTGSGKSTTLAAMIDYINKTRSLNIVTVEDPIEFLHKHGKSTIRQREVGSDTHSFTIALKHVLRHDPDVILIGEMRDLDSIAIALTAAETGHLVFSTLHTQTAPLTINRIVDVFGGDRRDQIRLQLANTLRGVISQQLIPRADGNGRAVAVELMLTLPAVKSMIREGKEHQLYSVIQTNQAMGMRTMDMALAKLYHAGEITKESALEYCIDRVEIERLLLNQAFSAR